MSKSVHMSLPRNSVYPKNYHILEGNMSFQFLTIRVICSSSSEKPRQVSLFTTPSKCTYYRCMTIYPLKTTSALVKAKRTWGCSSICEICHSSFFRLSIPTSVVVWTKNLGPRPGSGTPLPATLVLTSWWSGRRGFSRNIDTVSCFNFFKTNSFESLLHFFCENYFGNNSNGCEML